MLKLSVSVLSPIGRGTVCLCIRERRGWDGCGRAMLECEVFFLQRPISAASEQGGVTGQEGS